MTTFMIGADPELFVTRKGNPISVHDLLPGTKAAPVPLPSGLGAVQVDGTAAEFNINPVRLEDFESFNQNIVTTMKEVKSLLPSDCRLVLSSVQDYSPDYLASLPKEAIELGCDPDYNAYTMKANPRPDGERPFRTAAGHIHVGWGANIPVESEEHFEICTSFIKMMDATCGLYSVVIDGDPRRRELYGKAGAFRPKNYGVEYRTPANRWLNSKQSRQIMHYLIQLAVGSMRTYGDADRWISDNYGSSYDSNTIREIIDSNNVTIALELLRKRVFRSGHTFYNTFETSLMQFAKLDAPKAA